jgi:hypothetical protein
MGIMVVHSNAVSPDREDEYTKWYTEIHMPDLLAIPGFTAGRRYRIPDGADEPHTWVAVYDIDADDLQAPFKELMARSARGEVVGSDLVGTDPPPVIKFYELTEEQHAG